MAGAPSQLDLFDRKPELTRLEGKPLAAFGHRRPALRVHPAGRGRARPPVQVRQTRAMRGGALRDAAAPGRGRGRHLHHQVGAHRSVQPRPRADLLQHGLLPARPAQPGVLGALRSRVGDSGPARLRRDVDGERDQRRRGQLVERVPADRLHRRPLAEPGRPDPRRLQPAGRGRATPARLARPDRLAEPAAAPGHRRSRDRHANRVLRDGLPAPDLGARADGPQEREQGHAGALRRRSGQALVREGLPAGSADDRARRPVREYLPRGLGRPLRRGGEPQDELRRHRQGRGRADQGPQATRVCSTTRW